VVEAPGRSRGESVLAILVRDLVREERTGEASLEARAVGVITTAGTLVTVLFGLALLVTGRAGFVLPVGARGLLAGALASLVAASVAAIFVNLPTGHREINARDLLNRISSDDDWNAQRDDVERAVAKVLAVQLVAGREVNRRKARLLARAIFAEVAGVAFIGASVAVILATSAQ